MKEYLYLSIKDVVYRLCSTNGKTWRLLNSRECKPLNIFGAHNLDYWRRKGMIEGEEEKKNQRQEIHTAFNL